jgi:hypothetical protein
MEEKRLSAKRGGRETNRWRIRKCIVYKDYKQRSARREANSLGGKKAEQE